MLPAGSLNQNARPLGIPYNSITSGDALELHVKHHQLVGLYGCNVLHEDAFVQLEKDTLRRVRHRASESQLAQEG